MSERLDPFVDKEADAVYLNRFGSPRPLTSGEYAAELEKVKAKIVPDAVTPLPEPQAKLPSDPAARKKAPIARGVLDYFPLAIAEVARVSYAATAQHHPDKPMHWDRSKSSDHADCIVRHLIERGTNDTDGQRHSTKVAWRALALLQEELEAEKGNV